MTTWPGEEAQLRGRAVARPVLPAGLTAQPAGAFTWTTPALLRSYGARSTVLGEPGDPDPAAGGGILHAKGQISLAAAVVAPGLMVMAIILFMGAVSGAHLNPGVSLAFALRGDFPWRRVPGYIVIQLIGAKRPAAGGQR